MPIDIVGRAVERLNQNEGDAAVERAAERMNSRQQAFAVPPGAVENGSPSSGGDRTFVSRHEPVDIDFDRLATLGLVTPDSERTRTAEEIRIIKRPLLKHSAAAKPGDRKARLIMVTSAMPDEGKSFVAVNLAMSIALERNMNVLLVDGDTARPSLPHFLGVDTDEGLVDLLVDEKKQLDDVIVPTSLSNLSLLFAGQPHAHVTELIASRRMADLMRAMANLTGDWVVVFDAPPVLATSESSVLAMHMGQIVLVVEAQRTTRGAVEESLNLLDGGAKLNLVLNKSTARLGREQFGYGYDASYGYGAA